MSMTSDDLRNAADAHHSMWRAHMADLIVWHRYNTLDQLHEAFAIEARKGKSMASILDVETIGRIIPVVHPDYPRSIKRIMGEFEYYGLREHFLKHVVPAGCGLEWHTNDHNDLALFATW